MNRMNSDTALITGAGSGIGLALAREFAANGHPLVLTSRVKSELQNIAADLRRNHGRLLNTASVAGFEPGPLLAVYHASKAFVLSFTEALTIELDNYNISVTALCPGPTDTDFFPKAGMIRTKAFQKAHVMAP